MILATSAFHQNNFGIAMSPDPFQRERSGKGRQRQTIPMVDSAGHHFSPPSTAKTNDISTNLRKNGIY